MRFKWSGKKFEYFKVDADWWGTIAPPTASRFAPQFQTSGAVYLDLGTAENCIRNIYAEKYYACLGGGFATVVSGIAPTAGYHLTTKTYVDDAVGGISVISGTTSFSGLLNVQDAGWASGHISQFDGIDWRPFIPSLSGLIDVQATGWTSGVHVGFDGTSFVPSTQGGGGGISAHSLTSVDHTDVTGTPASGHFLAYDGSAWRPNDNVAPSGDYATVSQGHNLWQVSGNLMVSGDYATVSHIVMPMKNF